MNCKKCGVSLPAEAQYCHICGAPQTRTRSRKQRGNGQGSVYKRGKKYIAVVTLGYEYDGLNRPKRITRSKTFDKKSDAIAAIPSLRVAPAEKKPKTSITFKELYDLWFPTHRAGKSTLDCYRAAIKYFRPVWGTPMQAMTIDDLQECLDDCPRGKRTRENMKAMCNLVFKFGIPRNMVPLDRNLAMFLIVEGSGAAHRSSFTDGEIKKIRASVGVVPYADYIYCLIYLGFRPSEFLALTAKDYHTADGAQYFIGGSKTVAGISRLVTISPKISAMVQAALAQNGETVFCRKDGKHWARDNFADTFYSVLDAIGIDNPMIDIGNGVMRHKYTPHSCRHTFATLMKRVDGAAKDKQALIGHASEQQLKYYMDAPVVDLMKITNVI